jgi:hypothetical protein
MVAFDTIYVTPFMPQFDFHHISPSFDQSGLLITSYPENMQEKKYGPRSEIAAVSCHRLS